MSLVTITNKSLEKLTGHESIPEIYVTIAKMSVMLGSESPDIARQLGVDVEAIQEVEAQQVYKDIRLVLSVKFAEERLDRDISYDSLETMALERLVKTVPYEKDTDVLLRIATMANRATRRTTAPAEITPQTGNPKVPLRLSERIVRRINQDGSAEETRERSVSVLDGGAKNPSFEKVEGLFQGIEREDTPLREQSDIGSDPQQQLESSPASPFDRLPPREPTREDGLRAGVSPFSGPPKHAQNTMSPREKLALLAKKALNSHGIAPQPEGESE